MKSEELLELMNSWENLSIIIKEIDNFPEHFNLLMEIALTSDDPGSWRAAWMADKINDKHPSLIEPYVAPMIDKLNTEKQHGKKRHFLKLISFSRIPDECDSFLIDYCLNTLTSDHEPPANRVHAMQVLFNISEKIPDLKPELLDIIENEMEFHPTPGILTRGKKLALRLYKQISTSRIDN